MDRHPDFNKILDLTPATLHQLVSVQVTKLLSDHLPEIGLIRVTGILSDPGQPRGQWHYGLRLTDDGAQVTIDMPANLVAGRKLTAGKWVSVTGVLRVRMSKMGNLEIRVEVGDVRPEDPAPDEQPAAPQGRVTVDLLRSLTVTHYPFPEPAGRPLSVAVVQSSSAQAQVAQDCMGELEKLGSAIQVTPYRVNILDPAAVAGAIGKAEADVLLIIRGGGGEADFEVFDDHRVITALAGKHCYRVVGLGHSGNRTLLDLVADHSSRTPAQAGLHVREHVETKIRDYRAIQAAIAKAVEGRATEATPAIKSTADSTVVTMLREGWWLVLAAFLVGWIVSRVI